MSDDGDDFDPEEGLRFCALVVCACAAGVLSVLVGTALWRMFL